MARTCRRMVRKLYRRVRGAVLTDDKNSEQDRTDPRPGTSLALVTIPYIFTQDKLLTTDDFLRQVKDRGHRLTLEELQKLHANGLVVPFYRVDDTPIDSQRINVGTSGEMNARGWVLEAASSGRLRDPAAEGYSPEWPTPDQPASDLNAGGTATCIRHGNCLTRGML